jgi:hypothetical protein
MELTEGAGLHGFTRWAVWTVRATMCGGGMVISFLVANSAARAQLMNLGVGEPLLSLGPVCAGGCVLVGWYTGAELAGVRSESSGAIKWAERAMIGAMGALWLATGFCVMFQGPARWPDHTAVMLRMLAALVPPFGFGVVSAFGASPNRGARRIERGMQAVDSRGQSYAHSLGCKTIGAPRGSPLAGKSGWCLDDRISRRRECRQRQEKSKTRKDARRAFSREGQTTRPVLTVHCI